MTEPVLFGLPISIAFLYFIVYSFLVVYGNGLLPCLSTALCPEAFFTDLCAPFMEWGF